MKTLYDRFVHRNIFYHPHILVKPKQFMTRSLRFWQHNHPRKTWTKTVKSIQGYWLHVDIFEAKRKNRDVIILVHGHFSDKTEFNMLVPQLKARGYDVAVYNVYGEWKPFSCPAYTYGKKEKEDLASVVNALNMYENIHIVGHSLGAAIVAEYTATFTESKVRTLTMVALYESLHQAIDVGIEQTPLPFFTLKVDAQKHMSHFSKAMDVDLYQQDMKHVLKHADERHLMVFGERDVRAPYFATNLPTRVIQGATHTSFFTSKRARLIEAIDIHIQSCREK